MGRLSGGGFASYPWLMGIEHYLAAGAGGGQGVGLAGLGQREGGRDRGWLQPAGRKAAGQGVEGPGAVDDIVGGGVQAAASGWRDRSGEG